MCIILKNVIVPPDLIPGTADKWYGFHLGAVVAEIDINEKVMIEKHLSLIDGFQNLTKQVKNIDYSNYQTFGNYAATIKKKLRTYIEI